MTMKRVTSFMALLLALPTTALADLTVSFEEAAPTDFFIVENESDCELRDFVLRIDLNGTAGGLLFDVTAGGAGLSVYQPFQIAEGRESIRSFGEVSDGDRVATIEFARLEGRDRVVFTGDVDDTLANGPMGQTMIDGSEIAGAGISINLPGDPPVTAVFGPNGRAAAKLKGCGPIS